MSTLRQRIHDKSQGKCWYCGDELLKGWHQDHFRPIIRKNVSWMSEEAKEALGARDCEFPDRDTEENKVPACASCNLMKSQLNIEEFRILISSFIKGLNRYSNQYKFAKRYGLVEELDKPVVFWFESKD